MINEVKLYFKAALYIYLLPSISFVFFVTVDYVCLLVLEQMGNCCTLELEKDLSDDDEGCGKGCLRVYFGICFILKGCD